MQTNIQIITWLKDAHAMEQGLESVLRRHIDDAWEFPAIRERLKEHLDETHAHATRVGACLETFGETPSAMKSAAGTFMGAMQGMSTGMFADGLITNALADYAMEHFEIACYTSLHAAATEAGFDKIAQACREILAEEQRMADWLREQIPQLTRMQLELPAGRSSR